MFHSSVYEDRRLKLCENVANGVILLMGNGQLPINFPANKFSFRQYSTFLYYTGLSGHSLAVLMDTAENKCMFFGTRPRVEWTVWYGKMNYLAAELTRYQN